MQVGAPEFVFQLNRRRQSVHVLRRADHKPTVLGRCCVPGGCYGSALAVPDLAALGSILIDLYELLCH